MSVPGSSDTPPGAPYSVGDVVTGRFSCDPKAVTNALVDILVPGRGRSWFSGRSLVYTAGKGYGAWGYDDEVTAVRDGTFEDEQATLVVRVRVEADTAAFIQRLRA